MTTVTTIDGEQYIVTDEYEDIIKCLEDANSINAKDSAMWWLKCDVYRMRGGSYPVMIAMDKIVSIAGT